MTDGIINETSQRIDAKGPEISLNPLETVGVGVRPLECSQFVQVMHQVDAIDPALMRVKLARGGDPTFPLNVRLSGESVQGTSGSFREFVIRMVHELVSPTIGLLQECPSVAVGRFNGRYLLKPGPLSYSASKMLEFVGVLIGVALRADVPLALDMMPAFWKGLAGDIVTAEDINNSDLGTFRHIAEVMALDEAGFTEHDPPITFQYHTLDGQMVALPLPAGSLSDVVTVANRSHYVAAIQVAHFQ